MEQQTKLEMTLRDYLERQGVQALVRLVTAPDPFEGTRQLVETYGVGPLVPNTILLGDNRDPNRRDRYCQMIADVHAAGRSVLILRDNPDLAFGQRQRIDVWWGGRQANGSLMLLLAYLLKTGIRWRNADVCLKLVVQTDTAAAAAQTNMASMLDEFRLGVRSQVLVANQRSFADILQESSRSADLIFLGMATPGEYFQDSYDRLHRWVEELPTTIFVLAAPSFAFSEVLSE